MGKGPGWASCSDGVGTYAGRAALLDLFPWVTRNQPAWGELFLLSLDRGLSPPGPTPLGLSECDRPAGTRPLGRFSKHPLEPMQLRTEATQLAGGGGGGCRGGGKVLFGLEQFIRDHLIAGFNMRLPNFTPQ